MNWLTNNLDILQQHTILTMRSSPTAQSNVLTMRYLLRYRKAGNGVELETSLTMPAANNKVVITQKASLINSSLPRIYIGADLFWTM
jgi:hypothetical protein